jgi:limonene-1,2-epoxide hydrolase
MASDAELIVERLLRSYERGDVDEMLECFTENAVYHPIPMRRAVGKPAIRQMVSEWFKMMTVIGAEIHRQVSDGQTVMHERTDRCMVGDREVVTPTAAIYDIEDGLISGWREYFDIPR